MKKRPIAQLSITIKLLNVSIFLLMVIPLESQNFEIQNRCSVFHSHGPEYFEEWIQSRARVREDNHEMIYRLPVVVHVLHYGEPIGEGHNIPSEQIHAQIRILNEDFRRKKGTNGFNTHPSGGDTRVEFELAKRAPDGTATDGIVRINMDDKGPPGFGANLIFAGAFYSIWDTYNYLNIWSTPGIEDAGLGYSRFPIADLPGLGDQGDIEIPGFEEFNGIPLEDVDGIAINYNHFGEVNTSTKYNLGRTGTHEMGHFLGLYHTWGNQGFTPSCEVDDFCSDTPNISGRTTGCPSERISCDGTPAMIENYMDGSDDACMNTFTICQISRMRYVLENSPRRKSLINNENLLPPDTPLGTPGPNSDSFSIFPNPYDDAVYLSLNTNMTFEDIHIRYFDLSGLLIGTETLTTLQGHQLRLNPPHTNAQTILVSVKSNGEIKQFKLTGRN